MKKIKTTLLIALCTIALTGCELPTEEQLYRNRIDTFTYKGHKYIVLKGNDWSNGITHDPDCRCHNKQSEE